MSTIPSGTEFTGVISIGPGGPFKSETAKRFSIEQIKSEIAYTPVTIGSPANGLSISGTQVLTIGLASTSTTGALSSTDWNTFNNKLNLTSPITGYTVGSNTALADTDTILGAFGKVQGQINAKIGGTIASGQVAFGTGTGTIEGDSGLVWDNVNKRLGLGISIPTNSLNIETVGTSNSQVKVRSIEFQSFSINNAWISENLYFNGSAFIRRENGFGCISYFQNGQFQIRTATNGAKNSTASFGSIRFSVMNNGDFGLGGLMSGGSNVFQATLVGISGKVGINGITPTDTLDVNGTARIRTLSNATGDFVTASATGVLQKRTLAELRSDLGVVDQFTVKTTATADQTLPSGTLTILDYDSTLLNNSAATYTVGTDGRITINTTGIYTITAGVVIEANAVTALESAFLGIFRNGDLVAISSINTTIAAGAQSGLSTSTILSLTATDIIDCRALVNSVGGVANGLARRLGTLLGANATQVNSLSITKNSQ